jgi:DNA-binding NarL/FixJ family response regulator
MTAMTTATTPATPAGSRERGVLLIDDHRVFTDVLALALDAQPDLRCVAVAHSVREGLAKAAVYDFDAAIVDLNLPDSGGLSALSGLHRLRPHAQLIVLTAHPRADLAAAAYRAGAHAFLAKDDALHSVLGVIRGARPDPRRAQSARSSTTARPQLTPREHEVLAMLATGADARRIARDLRLSLHTVRDYIKAILAKLGVHSQNAAVAAATEVGLLTDGKRFP